MNQNRSRQQSEALVAEVVRAQLGAAVSRFSWLRGALGFRSFSRIWLEASETTRQSLPETLIARIEAADDPSRRPAGVLAEPALEPIRALLESEGLPVPRRFGADPARGIELLEDLGERSLADFARSADARELDSLYREACELPPRLQRIEARPGVANFARQLDDAHLRYKAERFARWSLHRDRAASPEEATVVREAFERIAREIRSAPRRLAHRDLQSANLQLVETPRGSAAKMPFRLVMIDLQGAFMAPPEYDLVCLLRDSYVELTEAAVAAHLARVRSALPDCPDAEIFQLRFDLLTLSRKAKDHALFRAVARERGDERYLQYLPATRRYLQTAAARVASKYPEYADLNHLIQAIPELP